MRSSLNSLVAAALLALPAVAGAGDAGMAVSVAGEVQTKLGGSGKPIPLEAFSRLQSGDVVEIPKDGGLQILFYDTGRKETWPGPSTVKIGETAATLVQGGVEPAVEDMGGNVGEGMNNLQVILTRAEKERGGMTLVRGSAAAPVALDAFEQQEIDAARTAYERLAATTRQPHDIVAEMYYASVLLTYDQRDAARQILTTASERCGGCEAPKLLLDWASPPAATPQE